MLQLQLNGFVYYKQNYNVYKSDSTGIPKYLKQFVILHYYWTSWKNKNNEWLRGSVCVFMLSLIWNSKYTMHAAQRISALYIVLYIYIYARKTETLYNSLVIVLFVFSFQIYKHFFQHEHIHNIYDTF